MTPGLRRQAAPDLASVGQEDALVARIHAEIARDGPITFARFMELALYDEAGGYYRAATPRPGRHGDFLTAPETHPVFGAALARGLEEVWERLDRPDPFVFREYGAGTGALIVAVLDRLALDRSGLEGVLRYDPIEVEPRRLDVIADRLTAMGRADVLVEPGLAGQPIVGVVLGNELLDALPTHRVVVREGHLLEIVTGSRDGQFVDLEAPPTTRALAERLAGVGIELVEGQRAEVCLALDHWVGDAAAGMAQGLLLLIDYGYPAGELYDPARRRDGTLRAYVRQRVHDDPYRHLGRQDLTAHVDVTAVERAAARAGLVHVGTTTQAEFLVGLGTQDLLQAIQADPTTTMEAYLELRSALMRLIDPGAMGRFRVMGFGRAWPDGPPLAGFAFRVRRP